MVYLIYTILALAFLHFVYEGILVPSFRLKLRFELFKLRDQLRNLKANHSEVVPDDIFRSLQNGINNSLKLLPRTDVVTVLNAHRKIANDPKLSQLRDKQFRKFNENLNEHTRPIFEQCSRLFLLTVFVNNGMLALYLLPVFLFLLICLFIGSKALRSLTKFMDIVFMPENQVDNIIPADVFAAA